MDTSALDFYIDADDRYTPTKMPRGAVKMGGKDYLVRCPKDSLPILLGRIEKRSAQISTGEDYEEVIQTLCAAVFEKDDINDIIERVISPHEQGMSIAFLMSTVRDVHRAYEPYMEQVYAELGMENPVKQPQDHKPSTKAVAKKSRAKKTAPRAPRRAAAGG